jgi:phage major head subunit gpT-like protein
MLTRSDIPKLLTAGLQTIFQKAYGAVPVIYTDFTTEIPSGKAEEVYAWLGGLPELKEWKDEKAPKALLEHGFTIKNKDYEATISVNRNALADDQYGQITVRVQQLGASARKGFDKEAARIVEAGHSTVCYDGQNFFDTDHSEGTSGTQSNYSSSGLALSSTNIKTIITAMRGLKDDTGQLAGINPTHIMVPTGLEFTAKEIFDPTFVNVTTDPSKATLNGLLKVIVNPYLANAGTVANSAYYVLDLSQPVKPFVFQNRENITFMALDKPDSPANFMRKEMYYGVEARFAFGYGDWKLAYKAQG